jgi:integrase
LTATRVSSTLRGYREALDHRVLPELGALRLAEVERGDIQPIIARMLAEGASASAVRNAVVPLQAIYRQAIDAREVTANPTEGLRLPKVPKRPHRIAPPDEARALLDALPALERPLWATAMYAGLRRGELRALRWSDVDLASGLIRVERSWDAKAGPVAAKSDAGHRTVPVTPVLRDVLAEHKLATGRDGDALVFGARPEHPFDPSSVQRRARRAWRGAGLEPIKPHDCRHTFASLMIAAGVNAKALSTYMGHATIGITLDLYGHLMPGSEAEAAERLHAYLTAAGADAARTADEATDAPGAPLGAPVSSEEPMRASGTAELR